MGSLVAGLEACLAPNIRLGHAVKKIKRVSRGFELDLGQRGRLRAQRLVVATSAHAAARLLGSLDSDLAQSLTNVRHSGYAAVHLAYTERQIEPLPPGTGFVVPAAERRAISACSWVSQKWPGRAPAGCVLLRCFVRDSEAKDEELVAQARREMRELLGIEATPMLTHVVKRARALPIYGLDQVEQMRELSERCADTGPLALAGNQMRGVGLSDCIASGYEAALRIQGRTLPSVV
jgi:oxygen-dependent protoporphyrinogen oxidase